MPLPSSGRRSSTVAAKDLVSSNNPYFYNPLLFKNDRDYPDEAKAGDFAATLHDYEHKGNNAFSMPLDSLLAGRGDPRIRRRPEPESVEFPGTGARRKSHCGPATARCTRRPTPFAASEPAHCSPHLFFGNRRGRGHCPRAHRAVHRFNRKLLFWTRSSATRGESGGAAVQKVEKGMASGGRRCRCCNIEADVQNFYGAYNPNGLLFQPDGTVSVGELIQPSAGFVWRGLPEHHLRAHNLLRRSTSDGICWLPGHSRCDDAWARVSTY
jgi:hypothetical protein